MNKTRLLSFAVAVLMLMNIGIVAFFFITRPPHPEGPGGPGGPEGPEGGRRPKDLIIERLHLDHDQIGQYDKLIEEHRAVIHTTSEEMDRVRHDLYSTLPSPDAARTDSLTRVLGTLVQRIERAHFDHVTGIKGLCRPDQMRDFNAFSEELADIFMPKQPRPR